MEEQLDFLPGSLEEKMRPWLQPIYEVVSFSLPEISEVY
jgi:predicted ribonuclease YlaK